MVWRAWIFVVFLGGWCSDLYIVPAADSTYAYVPGNLLLGVYSDSGLGDYLIGSNGLGGMTLYTYMKDEGGRSNCTGQCEADWPPYTVASAAELDSGVEVDIKGQVGSIRRADGSLQVTYNGSPLYFCAKDKDSSDVAGQNVGGVWHVAKP
jgi:predicted lipoprotein with Yx(FWY)xxD motif